MNSPKSTEAVSYGWAPKLQLVGIDRYGERHWSKCHMTNAPQRHLANERSFCSVTILGQACLCFFRSAVGMENISVCRVYFLRRC